MHTPDIVIVGAGPVGLMCAYLASLCGLKTMIFDPSAQCTEMGRADALNARTLQLLQIVGLFDELYPLGKPCNTSSVWKEGQFVSRQSSWWESLEGCFHKHFLMLGQSHIEKLLEKKLNALGSQVNRLAKVENIELTEGHCLTTLSSGEKINSKYVIGADGSRSFVRNHFNIPFKIVRPQITWAVVDGVIETDFPKVPEIIVFQNETSDVAWIPREGDIDRFYVRMDSQTFTFEQVSKKIDRAIWPHSLKFKKTHWYSQFSVRESVAEKFFLEDRVFLVGDACHIHSVNGGQGLNTGLADAFNLIWKINAVLKQQAPKQLLGTYETERRPVALSVIESSGLLVRVTQNSPTGTHAQDYVKTIEKYSGNITGMGIHYGENPLIGTRLYDCNVGKGLSPPRLYQLLDYSKYTLLIFRDYPKKIRTPSFVKTLNISIEESSQLGSKNSFYQNQAFLVRPDSYIGAVFSLNDNLSQSLENALWMTHS